MVHGQVFTKAVENIGGLEMVNGTTSQGEYLQLHQTRTTKFWRPENVTRESDILYKTKWNVCRGSSEIILVRSSYAILTNLICSWECDLWKCDPVGCAARVIAYDFNFTFFERHINIQWIQQTQQFILLFSCATTHEWASTKEKWCTCT